MICFYSINNNIIDASKLVKLLGIKTWILLNMSLVYVRK